MGRSWCNLVYVLPVAQSELAAQPSTLVKKILLPGIEPVTYQSWVWHSTTKLYPLPCRIISALNASNKHTEPLKRRASPWETMHFPSFCRDADTVNENSVSAMWILYCREKYNAATGCYSVIYLGEFSLLFMATYFKQLSWPLVVRHAQHAAQQFATPQIKLFGTFHASVVDIVPPTAAISGYTIGLHNNYTHSHAHAHLCTCMHARMHTHMRTHACTHACTRMHAHTSARARTHTQS